MRSGQKKRKWKHKKSCLRLSSIVARINLHHQLNAQPKALYKGLIGLQHGELLLGENDFLKRPDQLLGKTGMQAGLLLFLVMGLFSCIRRRGDGVRSMGMKSPLKSCSISFCMPLTPDLFLRIFLFKYKYNYTQI